MVKRPTIPDLAEASGVSVSTVNRVLNRPDSVREPTRARVLLAAEDIGFYGLGTKKHSVLKRRETYRLGILLQQGNRPFYRSLAETLIRASERHDGGKIDLALEFLDDLSPDNVAEKLAQLGESRDSVALVAAQHPLVADAIDVLLDKGVRVTSLIAPLSARGNVGFVGLDYWKVGRTAAWAFDRMVRQPGKIGVLVGNFRYRNQELNEMGFRSYFREHNTGFEPLEALPTYESATVARDIVERLLEDHPGMCGLFISGGGITGALAALRANPKREDFVAVGYDLFAETRAALIDGTLTLVISHPLGRFAAETIAAMVRATRSGPESGAQQIVLDFEIYTPENV